MGGKKKKTTSQWNHSNMENLKKIRDPLFIKKTNILNQHNLQELKNEKSKVEEYKIKLRYQLYSYILVTNIPKINLRR